MMSSHVTAHCKETTHTLDCCMIYPEKMQACLTWLVTYLFYRVRSCIMDIAKASVRVPDCSADGEINLRITYMNAQLSASLPRWS